MIHPIALLSAWLVAAPGEPAPTANAAATASAAVATKTEAPAEASRLLTEVKGLLLSDFYDEKLAPGALDMGAAQGMVAILNGGKPGGPNALLSPSEVGALHADLKGETVGIGVMLEFDSGSGIVKVAGIVPGSSAEAAGISAGDRLVSIEGKAYAGRSLPDVVGALRGKEGTSVRVGLLRGAGVQERTLLRKKLSLPSVEQTSQGDVGVLVIRHFSERTPGEMEAALKALSGAGMKRLLIDMRNNGGGLFERAIDAAELLVPSGAEIVRTVGRGGKTKHHVNRRAPLLGRVPMVVLVDGRTASSAEVVAEALRVGAGATLVGGKTFGKWRMETLRPLSGGYAIKFTIAMLQSPRGQSFDGLGLTPDVEVAPGPLPPDTTQRQKDLGKRQESDPQLKTALHLLRLRS